MRSTRSIQRASGVVFDNTSQAASEQKLQKLNVMNQNGRGNPIGPMGGAPGRREQQLSMMQTSNITA